MKKSANTALAIQIERDERIWIEPPSRAVMQPAWANNARRVARDACILIRYFAGV
jgi:hypothetical protein